MSYFSSQLFKENPVYDSDFFANFDPAVSGPQIATMALFYSWFGLFWIHASYPNYLLADLWEDSDSTVPVGYQAGLTYDSGTSDGTDPVWEMADALAANAAPDMLNSDGSL